MIENFHNNFFKCGQKNKISPTNDGFVAQLELDMNSGTSGYGL